LSISEEQERFNGQGEPSITSLSDLGFDDWFADRTDGLAESDFIAARVTVVDRSRYRIRNAAGEVQAEVTGKILYDADSSIALPVIGDWVLAQYHNDNTFAIIHKIYPRKSILQRKTAGKKVDLQPIAANIDLAFIVQSCVADFNLRRLERYLVMARDGGIQAAILLTKSDLVSSEEQSRKVEEIREIKIECDVLVLSNLTGDGLDGLRKILIKGRTYCLLGSSGVGKTTLLNLLVERDLFATQPVRPGDGRGRHTTARRQLIVLENGAMVIDTPGMRELGNMSALAGVDETFEDLHELAATCRFADCSHQQEPGCALREAIEQGRLDRGRFTSYLKLRREAERNRMSYAEKHKRDRDFGKYVKSVMKYSKKK
jgi:ribosome biogenesis GTPase / thiamine phosphate phosphatase